MVLEVRPHLSHPYINNINLSVIYLIFPKTLYKRCFSFSFSHINFSDNKHKNTDSRSVTVLMAALRTFLRRKPTSSDHYSMALMKKLFSTQPIIETSPSFTQRLRNLPKDLPGTNIRKEVSQVISLSLQKFFFFFFASS